MTQDLELIRQKCIEANPEIATEYPSAAQKEEAREFLQENPYRDDYILAHMERFMNSQGEADDTSISLANEWDEMKSIDDAKIQKLYRPISLADVLLAMRNAAAEKGIHGLPNKYIGDYFVTVQGDFIHWKPDSDEQIEMGIANYSLRTDDLEKQSEETIKFLAELLK